MNHKQKLAYMALGALILALGITIGQVITPTIEAQNNGVFDDITCRSLRVVDEKGEATIYLGNFVYEEWVPDGDFFTKEKVPNGHGIVIMDASTGDRAISLSSYSHEAFPETAITVWDRAGASAADNSKHKKAFEVNISGLSNVLKVYDKDLLFPKEPKDTGIGFYAFYDNLGAELTRFVPYAETISTRKEKR